MCVVMLMVCARAVGEEHHHHVKAALKRGTETGLFKQTKGVGATGSFRLGEKPKKVKAAKPAPAEKKAAKPKAEKKAKVCVCSCVFARAWDHD